MWGLQPFSFSAIFKQVPLQHDFNFHFFIIIDFYHVRFYWVSKILKTEALQYVQWFVYTPLQIRMVL